MGRKTKPGISIDSGLQEGYAALGFVKTMVREVDTDMYLSDIIDYTHAILDREFTEFVNTAALSNPDAFKHVYEPGKIGLSQYKLWTSMIYGRGRKREASFEWKMSTIPIATPEERKRDKNDPMSSVPDDIIAKISDRRYVFRMQAPIMEYRMKTTVTPKYSKFIFIPTFETQYHRTSGRRSSGKREYAGRNYRFEKYNVPDWDYRNPQEPSGSGSTVGRFTGAWVTYWNGGGAEQTWNADIAPKITKDIIEAGPMIAKAARMKRSRKTGFEISTFSDHKAAFESGANLARAFIRGKARSYKKAADYISRRGIFGEDREY